MKPFCFIEILIEWQDSRINFTQIHFWNICISLEFRLMADLLVCFRMLNFKDFPFTNSLFQVLCSITIPCDSRMDFPFKSLYFDGVSSRLFIVSFGSLYQSWQPTSSLETIEQKGFWTAFYLKFRRAIQFMVPERNTDHILY